MSNRPAAEQTAVIVSAANALLNSLSTAQRDSVSFEFVRQKAATGAKFQLPANFRGPGGPGNRPDQRTRDSALQKPNAGGGAPPDGRGRNGGGGGLRGEQYGKAVWSNFPVTFVPRPGLRLGNLSSVQRRAAMQLLKELLSVQGYEKVMEIMGSDQALADAGADFEAGNDSYRMAIFGTPNTTTPWMVEFGGHHLALNIVIAGAQGALTPTLTGAQPAVYQTGGKTIRVLAAENDKAFDLLNALDEAQRKVATLSYTIGDLVLGPGHDGEMIVPEGLKVSAMNTKQKEMLVDLITEWTGIMHNAYIQPRLQEIKDGLDSTYFAWSGPTTHQPGKNGSSYYRIQGPHVLIEFSPQGTGGDLTNHVHTIYRDPLNNYGNAFYQK